MMKIGRKHTVTQGFCIKPDYWGSQAPPPPSEILGGGQLPPWLPLVPIPLILQPKKNSQMVPLLIADHNYYRQNT